MNAKDESVERIRSILITNKVDFILLSKAIITKWTTRQNTTYQIRELRLSADGKVEAWQGIGFKDQQTIQYLSEFDEWTVNQVEKELLLTIESLKTYSVDVVSSIEVHAINPELAKETVILHSHEIKKKIQFIKVTDNIKEVL